MSIKTPTVNMLPTMCNSIEHEAILEAVKMGDMSSTEQGMILLKVSDKMFTELRKFVGHSTELNYFVFTHKPFLVSANVRAWYNLFVKNLRQGGDGKTPHPAFICKLLSKIGHLFPFFNILKDEMKIASCTELQGYFSNLFPVKKLTGGQYYMHIRPTMQFNCSITVLNELMEHRVFSFESRYIFDKSNIPFVNPGHKQRSSDYKEWKAYIKMVSERFFIEVGKKQAENKKTKVPINLSNLLYDLPGCTMVEVTMTGGIFNWQEFMAYRLKTGSDELKKLIDNVYPKFGVHVKEMR